MKGGWAFAPAESASKRVRRARWVPRCGALIALIGLGGLTACAAALPQTELRVLVKLAQPSTDSAAIQRLVSERAGVAARYLSAASPHWHALVLPCGGAIACEALLQQLRADRGAIAAVERDERKRIVSP
jgi:hypothetical protein